MKQVPKPAMLLIFLLGFLLIGFLVWQIRENNSSVTNPQYLDKLDIETDNPQPAGKNLAQ